MSQFNAAFWKWFGNSVVRNADGSPKVVYHGTTREFTKFNIDKCEFGCHFGSRAQAEGGGPVDWKGRRRRVVSCYLSIQRPLRLRDRGKWDFEDVISGLDELHDSGIRHGVRLDSESVERHNGDNKWLRKTIERAGYDGIVYLNRREGVPDIEDDEVQGKGQDYWDYEATDNEFRSAFPMAEDAYIIFQPEKTKSVDNDGTWDADDPDIRRNPGGTMVRPWEPDEGAVQEWVESCGGRPVAMTEFTCLYGLRGPVFETDRSAAEVIAGIPGYADISGSIVTFETPDAEVVVFLEDRMEDCIPKRFRRREYGDSKVDRYCETYGNRTRSLLKRDLGRGWKLALDRPYDQLVGDEGPTTRFAFVRART